MNQPAEPNSFRTGPDEQGMFGIFGGRFVAETLMPLILDLEQHWNAAKNDPAFREELKLHRPIFQKTAAYGHFGREDADFTWEKTDKADALRDAAGLSEAVTA